MPDKLTKHKYYPILLVILHGMLMFAGWPVSLFPIFLFVGFVPLLLLEEHFSQRSGRKPFFTYWGCLFMGLLLWNVSTTWWVINASLIGGIAAFVLNSILMTIPWLLYKLTKSAGGRIFGLIGLMCYWMTFEYIHLNWDMSWPWLNLGNGLAMYPQIIQWYSVTGTFGGTVWIFVSNCLIYLAIISPVKRNGYLIRLVAFLGVPVIISFYIYATFKERGQEVEVVVLQPNIDPYTEKFAGSEEFIPFPQQIDRFIKLTKKKITANTDFVVWPETAIDKWIPEEQLEKDQEVRSIIAFKKRYPNVSLITGLTSYTTYGNSKKTVTARYQEGLGYYDQFNTAFFIGADGTRQTYHKSKLVPGVEIMPYPGLLNFLIEPVFNLGGTTGGFGRQDERTVFYHPDNIGIAPAICYESIYGDFMAEYIRNGANLIFIITNDGWWGNTPGYRQHMQYAKLRAIELRRSVARSANTGISGFINQRGDIDESTGYWVQDVIRGTLKANETVTFYAKYGDYLARTGAWLSVFIILGAFVNFRMRKYGINRNQG